jgi:hypothetical protein
MLLTGLTVFLGVTLLLAKLPRRTMLKALKHEVAVDITVSAITLAIHWGSYEGIMAATIAGLLMSMATSAMKKLVGHIDGDMYYPGVICLKI